MMERKWMLRRSNININELAKNAAIDETIACILINRGISDIEAISKFKKASINDLYDPFLMKDMDKGTELIKSAILNNKNIVIYGDYDADGVTSTAIFFKALKRLGAKVKYHVPDRESEGYGMHSERVKSLKGEGIEVILTCDNGIAAIEQVRLAKELGMEIVITDHHEVQFIEDEEGNREYIIPQADAIINPKQKDCTYPFKSLCGAGIAFKFIQALYKKMDVDINEAYELIEIAGIGTICDVVDLVDENRIIAKNALKMLNTTKNLGLKALIEVIGMKDKKISSGTVGFQIGPCINATGRLDTAALSVELLLCQDTEKATELAKLLNDFNKQRQSITTSNVEEIISQIESSDIKNDRVFVIYKEDVHESIAGIVAGRIKDRYNVPTIVLTKGKEMPKGSARSIEEYNLFEELLKCKDLLSKFGGHPMAAGLSLEEDKIQLLRAELNKNCNLTEEDIVPKVRIDKRLPLRNVSYELIEQLEMLEPFGKGNESPVLAEKDVVVERVYILGKDQNTLKLNCRIGGTNLTIDALAFGKVDEFKELVAKRYGEDFIRDRYGDLKIDCIFSPYVNEYNGVKKIQIRLSDFRLAN